MNKKILISLALIGVVGVIATGATVSYFTDTESSVGNVFTAGSIDLKIDNHAWFNGGYMEEFSWELDDLTDQLFFNYTDLKPGDWEEDTISIRVDNNPAWICGEITITNNDDMTCTEPEMDDDPTCDEPDADIWDGDLAQELAFIYWVDDGDNVLESDEYFYGPISPGALLPDGSIRFPIADVNYSVAGYDPGTGLGLPIVGLETYYIAKAFCFGDIDIVPVVQDGYSDQMNPGSPQGPGFTCNGALVNNASQSDSLTGDISFTAVQYRNNTDYVCVIVPECEDDEDCDDENACTLDVCDEDNLCQNICLVDDPCDDGNDHTVNDKCTQVGEDCLCKGTLVECISNEECNDYNECTLDICDENGVCQNTCLVGQSCDDGEHYTINDECTQVGEDCFCEGEPVDCIDAGDCNDNDPCTIDTCENNVCVYTPIVCNDQDPCTTDACVDGTCVYTPIVCNDGDPCTTDACVGGECVYTPIVCNDGDPCTTDACVDGTCVYTPIVCDDQNPCTTDACVGGVCIYTPICEGTDIECGCTSCENCNDQDGWVDVGGTYACCQGDYMLCTCQNQEYIDYSCQGTSCVSATTNWRTVGTDCSTCYPYCCDDAQCVPCNY
ncbi:SipW-dependent-type signal peptide-containing protein [Candidatus Parcubacteria bacterium]|nr:SipW-dependent-type signal peptide-containing protein [Candidatus Parcubacteria bacterium]